MTKNLSRPVPCSIEGCEKPKRRRDWCTMHYERWRRHGDPTILVMAPKGAPASWIAQAVESQTDECLLWPYGIYAFGYGQVNHKGKPRTAHRVVLMLATGQDGAILDAAHAPGICHNPLCCNPRHLRWATRADNNDDKVIDDTHTRGERSSSAKLTEADVLAIRADNRIQRLIAADYGVSPRTVCDIKCGRSWAWLEDGAA